MKHSERREKVKAYLQNNKIFVIIAICLVIYLVTFFIRKDDTDVKKSDDSVVSEETTEQEETDNIEWRFYWSDFFVLVGGVGFCSYKIIQRNKKAKEDM